MPDVFISHASQDKASVARPLADALVAQGYDVWYDNFTLQLGDSLRQRIDDGLGSSRYAVVILSPSFITSPWTKLELDGLIALETHERSKRILPVWHQITADAVARFSLMLSSRLAVSTTAGIEAVVEAIVGVLGEPCSQTRPELSGSETDDRIDGNPAARLAEAVSRAREYLLPQPLSISDAVAEVVRRSFSEARVIPAFAHAVPYLGSSEAAYRVVGYIAAQVAAQQGSDLGAWTLELAIAFGREQREALAHTETRPLWQLLVAVGYLIRGSAGAADRSYLLNAMRGTQSFLEQQPHIDRGRQCRTRLGKLVQTLSSAPDPISWR